MKADGVLTLRAQMPLASSKAQAGGKSTQPSPEAQLIDRCLAGKPEAFRELVDRYRESVWRTAYNLVGDRQWAYDISQEAFVRVYTHLARFDTRRSFWQWLHRIVVNLAIDHLRKQRRYKIIPLEHLANYPEGQVERSSRDDDIAERVHQTLARLPGKYRIPLALRELEGLSAREVARTLGLTYGLARWRLSHARKLFRKFWEEDERTQRGSPSS